MKKQSSIRVSLPHPCSQDWNNMLPVAGGRHCAQCRKMVVDFTTMSDAAFIAYLRKEPEGCGIYRPDQLDRELSLPVTRKTPQGAKWLLGLFMFFGWIKDGDAQQKHTLKHKTESAPVTLKFMPEEQAPGSVDPQLNDRARVKDSLRKAAQAAALSTIIPAYSGSSSGSGISSGGARSCSTRYIIDGVVLSNPDAIINVPPKPSLWKRLRLRKR